MAVSLFRHNNGDRLKNHYCYHLLAIECTIIARDRQHGRHIHSMLFACSFVCAWVSRHKHQLRVYWIVLCEWWRCMFCIWYIHMKRKSKTDWDRWDSRTNSAQCCYGIEWRGLLAIFSYIRFDLATFFRFCSIASPCLSIPRGWLLRLRGHRLHFTCL